MSTLQLVEWMDWSLFGACLLQINLKDSNSQVFQNVFLLFKCFASSSCLSSYVSINHVSYDISILFYSYKLIRLWSWKWVFSPQLLSGLLSLSWLFLCFISEFHYFFVVCICVIALLLMLSSICIIFGLNHSGEWDHKWEKTSEVDFCASSQTVPVQLQYWHYTWHCWKLPGCALLIEDMGYLLQIGIFSWSTLNKVTAADIDVVKQHTFTNSLYIDTIWVLPEPLSPKFLITLLFLLL